MKETPQNNPQDRRRFVRKVTVIAAAVLAVVQACLTIEGMGIEGFVLWVLILFVGYWLLFTVVLWLLDKRRSRL